MLRISQRCQYGVRSVFELARRAGTGPVKISDIATAQAIPPRFLEIILGQLRQAGLVDSKRGYEGGYYLLRPPSEITLGQVIRVLEGSADPIGCQSDTEHSCPMTRHCVFASVWERAFAALERVFDETTYQSLLDAERERLAEEQDQCAT